MPGRLRNTKALAQRIDRSYFKRVFPLQRWRWLLGSAVVLLSLVWIGVHSLSGTNAVYSAGPLTPAHAMLNRKCDVCHVRTGIFTVKVTDHACSTCHDGAIHQAIQIRTPQCVDCHTEHTLTRITVVDDRECTSCHSDLKVKSGPLKVAASIHAFSSDHPEFAFQRTAMKDPGSVKFNHAVHLKKDLRGATGNVTLACSDCHRTQNNEPWPYGKAVSGGVSSGDRKLMQPVNYEEHCSRCHPLTFDRRFSEPVPHKNPHVIHEFLTKDFTSWIAAHPEELRGGTKGEVRITGSRPAPVPSSSAAWILARVDESEQLLRVKTCKECHDLTPTDRGIPQIAKANITTHWMKNAEFDHSAHQMLVCDGCHSQALRSTRTSDVLIPGISVCRECHVSGKADAASSNCVECHVYHDPTKHKHIEGKFTLPQISELR